MRAQRLHPHGISRTALVRMLHGSKEKRQEELGLNLLPTYGILHDIPRKTITAYVDYLCSIGYINLVSGNVTVHPSAKSVLYHNEKVFCPEHIIIEEVKSAKTKKKKTSSKSQNETIFTMLKALRTNLAKAEHVPAYMIFSNATLVDMAQRKPRTKKQMLQVNGVGERKLEKYGDAFLEAIRTWEKIHQSDE